MKPFKEFTAEDLKQYINEYKLLRTDLRSTDNKRVVDYECLGEILGLQHRAVRNLVEGHHQIRRSHYNLLAMHAGELKPKLIPSY